MRFNKLSIGILAFLLLSCSGSGVPQENQDVKSYKVAEVLLELFYKKILPMLLTYKSILMMEKLRRWMDILIRAIASIPKWFGLFRSKKVKAQIDDVNYADIVNDVSLPGDITNC